VAFGITETQGSRFGFGRIRQSAERKSEGIKKAKYLNESGKFNGLFLLNLLMFMQP
jgi:hypothetical protein